MAYTPYEITSVETNGSSDNNSSNTITLNANQSEQLALPDTSYVTEADMLKDGFDLILQTPDGTVTIEGYFLQEPPPFLVAPDGKTLTPDLVDSFAHSPQEYANADLSSSDASPVGAVQEISGEAHVIRGDGTVEVIGVGTHIFQGDIVETEEDGAVNIMFIDETTFAISEDARLAIDEYVFDPATQSGTTNFSVLKGVFVFTSGLIGREDPDDVMIDTPSGSIGIRGTIIAGNVDTGEITVIEGAIVLHDFSGNTMTLSNQYETARFDTAGQSIEYVGEIGAEDVAEKFTSVSNVSGDLFSSLEDSAAESQEPESQNSEEPTKAAEETTEEAEAKPATETEKQPTEAKAPKETVEEGTEKASGSEEGTEEGVEAETEKQPAEAEEQKPLPATEESTIITSDEITGTEGEELSATGTAGNDMQKPPPAAEDTTNETQNTTEAKPPPQTIEEGAESPSFNIRVIKFSVDKDADGVEVARVTGNFTESTDLKLIGPLTANYYEIIQQDENNYIIKLRNGVTVGEAEDHPIHIEATNDLETVTINRHIDLNIAPEDSPIELIAGAHLTEYFTGSDESLLTYDMSQEFRDPEGQINEYILDTSGHAAVFNIEIDESTGMLTVDLFDDTPNDTFNFRIIARTSSGQEEYKDFTFNLVDTQDTAAGSIEYTTGTPDTYFYNTSLGSFAITGDGVTVFANDTDIANNIMIGGNGAIVRAGEGDDIFNIGANGYKLYGDSGDDDFTINPGSDGRGFIYGGDGKDDVIFQAPVADLHNIGEADTIIDGGAGRDIFTFSSTGDIDFGNVGDSITIDDNIIRNFEEFNIENGTGQNINLTYEEVVRMTDGDNVLAINTGFDDVINFDRDGHNFVQDGTAYREGEDYNVYTDGNITLLVDTDINPGNINLFG